MLTFFLKNGKLLTLYLLDLIVRTCTFRGSMTSKSLSEKIGSFLSEQRII